MFRAPLLASLPQASPLSIDRGSHRDLTHRVFFELMIIKLAIRNLFHDRARFLVTLVGILFAVLLVAIQLGMFFGARQMITAMVERANGDIWIGAYGADSIEQGLLLTGRERFVALSVPGVQKVSAAYRLICRMAQIRPPAPRMSSWSAPTRR